MKIKQFIIITALLNLVIIQNAIAQKPKVWIISDGSDKNIKDKVTGKSIGDPDDISAIASYLLMSNMFDTRAIVVGSKFSLSMDWVGSQKEWADTYFLKAYKKDIPYLNKSIGGYQSEIKFLESYLKENPKKYIPSQKYISLNEFSTIKALFEEVDNSKEIINVLCWGTLTEQAILVNYCLIHNRKDILNKIRFISHWTNSSFRVGTLEQPEHVHNCFNDADACAYMKEMAINGHIKFYECSGIGEFGIVAGSPKGLDFYNQFKKSEIGSIFVEGKYMDWIQTIDDSDCATYWALLGDWGVSLNDIASNGTNFPEVEQKNEAAFYKWSPLIRNELLRRAKLASKSN